jgi:hypothetical protein
VRSFRAVAETETASGRRASLSKRNRPPGPINGPDSAKSLEI